MREVSRLQQMSRNYRAVVVSLLVGCLTAGPAIADSQAFPATTPSFDLAVAEPASSEKHTVVVSVRSVYVHDDADAGANCGDGYSRASDPYSSGVTVNGHRQFKLDRGSSWSGWTQRYCSDKGYTFPAFSPGINRSQFTAVPGEWLDIKLDFVEKDLFEFKGLTEASNSKFVTVPAPNTVKDFSIMVEGSNGPHDHLRATFVLRVVTY